MGPTMHWHRGWQKGAWGLNRRSIYRELHNINCPTILYFTRAQDILQSCKTSIAPTILYFTRAQDLLQSYNTSIAHMLICYFTVQHR